MTESYYMNCVLVASWLQILQEETLKDFIETQTLYWLMLAETTTNNTLDRLFPTSSPCPGDASAVDGGDMNDCRLHQLIKNVEIAMKSRTWALLIVT